MRDVSLSRTEISSILARVLRPGDFVRFFVRFDLPDATATYNLRLKLKAMDVPEITRDLSLKVKPL